MLLMQSVHGPCVCVVSDGAVNTQTNNVVLKIKHVFAAPCLSPDRGGDYYGIHTLLMESTHEP